MHGSGKTLSGEVARRKKSYHNNVHKYIIVKTAREWPRGMGILSYWYLLYLFFGRGISNKTGCGQKLHEATENTMRTALEIKRPRTKTPHANIWGGIETGAGVDRDASQRHRSC